MIQKCFSLTGLYIEPDKKTITLDNDVDTVDTFNINPLSNMSDLLIE